MKKIMCLIMFFLFVTAVLAQEDFDDGFEDLASEDIYEDIEDAQIDVGAGITPDSAFYVLEVMFEDILVGDNPETALKYKEEKVIEVKEMIESGNAEAAEKAFARVEKYNKILQKEVRPDIEEEVRRTSKATKDILNGLDLDGEDFKDLKDKVEENNKAEDKIALAAKISGKIKDLCETLSDLDPLEYSKVCKSDDDSPEWKRDLDDRLTKEQEKEARAFFKVMSACFENPAECQCDEISVKPFAEECKIIAPLAAQCEKGDEAACDEMDDRDDPIELLPDYLQDVLEDIEDEYEDARHDHHLPRECEEAGATGREECTRVMFSIHAPPECAEALDRGEIDISNEREARKACEAIMFDLEAPEECKEEGIRDFDDCERFMFKLDAPQECLDAGITGQGRDDRRKCEIITFKLEVPQECLDAGLDGSGRDDWRKCDAIRFKLDAPQECLDAGLDGTGRDDWRKCEAINFKLDNPECVEAGIDGTGRDDWKKCDAIRFKLDAPQACLDAGLDGSGRDDWRKCEAINFKHDAPQVCLDAGLDGSGRRDWDECQKIQFRDEAPQECLDAGLDGSGRRDWEKCDKIRGEMDEEHFDDDLHDDGGRHQHEDFGDRPEDCNHGEVHYCDEDGRDCRCVDEDDLREKFEEDHRYDNSGPDHEQRPEDFEEEFDQDYEDEYEEEFPPEDDGVGGFEEGHEDSGSNDGASHDDGGNAAGEEVQDEPVDQPKEEPEEPHEAPPEEVVAE